MSYNVQKKFFDTLLTEAGINPKKFCRLFHVLEDAPYIESGSVHVTHKRPYAPLTLMATYSGDEQIGHARKGHRGSKPEVRETVTRIYGDISRRSGIGFARIHPGLDDEECIGYADIGVTADSSLPLVLEAAKKPGR